MTVYADNAATTKISKAALNEILPYFEEIYGNPSSGHSAGRKAAIAVRNARKDIADIIGASPDEIFFTSSGTESDNQAILSAAKIGAEKGKKHIVSTAVEHHAVLNTLSFLKERGFEITFLYPSKDGLVTAEQVKKAIRGDTCLVSVMYANNEIGTVMPVSEIGRICREKNVLFFSDAVAAAGYLPIDVKSQNIDMLSMSAHKFHGPKGCGILYRRKGTDIFPLIRGGSQEKGLRAGTENVPAIIGTAAALRESYENYSEKTKKLLFLRDALIDGFAEIPHSALNGGRENRLAGNVNFSFEGIEGESLLVLLDTKGICASSGSACTSFSSEPSHVLTAIGREKELADASLRLTLSAENTADEVSYIIKTVKESVEFLRSLSQPFKDKSSGKRKFIL